MPRIKLSDELKEAIALLPPKEKDKLLFRLIAKEPDLVAQLEFKLLEEGETLEERRKFVYNWIGRTIQQLKYHFYSPGYLLLDLRAISGEINRHVKTTKDKYGEIELNFCMLNLSLELFGDEIKTFSFRGSKTFNEYVVKRAIKLLKLLSKMHEDMVLDFQSDMKALGRHIQKSPHMLDIAQQLDLDVTYLLDGEIPE